MSAVWTVAAREIRARRILLVAIPVVAALPFLARLMGGEKGRDIQEAIGLLVCGSFPFAVALGVGASLFSRELAERRLGFYFARPISAQAFWAGKVMAALVVVLAAFAFMQVPVALSLPRSYLSPEASYSTFVGVAFLAALLVMAAANAVTSMYRARSPWLVLDVVMAAVCIAALARLTRAIVEAGAFLSLRAGLPILLAAGVVAFLGAAAMQVMVGRTDARRAHLAHSATVWASVLLILGGFAMWQRWLLAGTPAQAGGTGYPLVAAPSGEGIFFRGLTGRAGFRPFFLMDAADGSFLRISPESDGMPTFSGDGRIATWVSMPEPWEPDHRPRLWVVRLGDGVRPAERLPMEAAMRWHTVLAVYPDGRQAVIAGFGAAGLVDLDTARVGASTALPDVVAADVLTDGRVRLFHGTSDRGGLAVAIWSPRDGSVAETLRVPRAVLLARRGAIAVVAVGLREKAILDLAAATEHRVTGADADNMPRALVLENGRIAMSTGTDVRITDAAGTTLATVPLPPKSQVVALREAEPGRVAVGVWSLLLSKRGTLLVDSLTGAVVREERGLLPAGAQSGTSPQAAPGSLAARLVTDEDGALVALEPGGAQRVIVAAAAGRE